MQIDYRILTERARKVFQSANRHAHELGHEYVGTEHLLLGMIDDPNSVPTAMLRDKCNLGNLRQEIIALITPDEKIVCVGKLPQTPRTKLVVESAVLHAEKYGDKFVGPEHLLAGLVNTDGTAAFDILSRLGVTSEWLADQYRVLLQKNAEPLAKLPCMRNVQRALIACHDQLLATQLKDGNIGAASEYLAKAIRWLSEHNAVSHQPAAQEGNK